MEMEEFTTHNKDELDAIITGFFSKTMSNIVITIIIPKFLSAIIRPLGKDNILVIEHDIDLPDDRYKVFKTTVTEYLNSNKLNSLKTYNRTVNIMRSGDMWFRYLWRYINVYMDIVTLPNIRVRRVTENRRYIEDLTIHQTCPELFEFMDSHLRPDVPEFETTCNLQDLSNSLETDLDDPEFSTMYALKHPDKPEIHLLGFGRHPFLEMPIILKYTRFPDVESNESELGIDVGADESGLDNEIEFGGRRLDKTDMRYKILYNIGFSTYIELYVQQIVFMRNNKATLKYTFKLFDLDQQYLCSSCKIPKQFLELAAYNEDHISIPITLPEKDEDILERELYMKEHGLKNLFITLQYLTDKDPLTGI